MTPLLLVTLLAAPWPQAAAVDSVVRSDAFHGFSGAVIVGQGDRTLYSKTYAKGGTPGDPATTAYWIAANSRSFTAAAILRLEETGRLRVTDSLPRFFDEVPADKRHVTIHQLLANASGLPMANAAEGVEDRDEAVQRILQLPLGTPGRFISSNDGYVLLAAIIEQASGQAFDTYLRDSVIARAGLTHTGLWGLEPAGLALAALANPQRAAVGRPGIYGGGHTLPNWGRRGSTGVYSTAEDLRRWVQALTSGRILNAADTQRMLAHHVLVRADSTGEVYSAYGWTVRVAGGRDLSYGFVGYDDWLGHSSVVRWTPAGELVIVLSNAGERSDGPWANGVNRHLRDVLDSSAPAASGPR